jgi:Ca2+-binding EF-hand superfamily protein
MSSATSASSDVKEMFTSEIAEVTDGGAEDDEFVLTEAHVVAIRMIFKQFDTDGSGTIEPVELSKLCAALGDPLNKRELREAFDHLDMNDNGKIGFEEFINFWRES